MTTDTRSKKPEEHEKQSDKEKRSNNSPAPKDIKTGRRTIRYLLVGIGISLFNFATYTLINYIFLGIKITDQTSNGNEQYLWLSTLISTIITTIVAYFAHSKITWKERNVTKYSIIRFFIWNAILAFAVGPWITQLFSLFTPLYDLAHNICEAIHIPFTYDFIQSTGAFVLTSIVVMILNYLFYDRFVFGKSNSSSHSGSPK